MIILDVNILIYSYNSDAPQHAVVRDWFEDQFASAGRIGIPWLSLWAFIRIYSNPRVNRESSLVGAFKIAHNLLAHPQVSIIEPGPRHAEALEHMATTGRTFGPMLTDAALAALAIEHGASLASTDRDFARFPGLKWINPLDLVGK